MAFNSYLKIATIEGEATAKGYEKHIELSSYGLTVSQHSGGSMSAAGGLSGGRVDLGSFSVTKPLDSASPKLAQSCCTGEHIKDITVDVLRATGEGAGTKFMQYKMSDVIVSSIAVAGSSTGGTALPQEEVQFSYGKIEWTYTQVGQDGKKKGDIKTGWNVSTGSKV
jgi:type VI secretion system secreted protein Hcp